MTRNILTDQIYNLISAAYWGAGKMGGVSIAFTKVYLVYEKAQGMWLGGTPETVEFHQQIALTHSFIYDFDEVYGGRPLSVHSAYEFLETRIGGSFAAVAYRADGVLKAVLDYCNPELALERLTECATIAEKRIIALRIVQEARASNTVPIPYPLEKLKAIQHFLRSCSKLPLGEQVTALCKHQAEALEFPDDANS